MGGMNEARAREILGEFVNKAGQLEYCGEVYVSAWEAAELRHVSLDGSFSLDQLRAIVWWMENHNARVR